MPQTAQGGCDNTRGEASRAAGAEEHGDKRTCPVFLSCGGTRIPGCDLQQNALQLDQPTIIGSAIADANGVASITRTVPLIARGQTILFQAVVQNECAISQLVVHQFE